MKLAAVANVLALALALSAPPAAAQAQVGYTARTAHLRAGPGRDYPVVAILAPGLQLLVQGCVPDYTWCDVVVGPNRGWVYAGSIDYYYQNAYVPLLSYGAVIGIGVFPFVLHDYWGRYYYNRPWYADRYRWDHDGDRHSRGEDGRGPGRMRPPPVARGPQPGRVEPRHGMPLGARRPPQPVPVPAPAAQQPLPSVAPAQPRAPVVQPPRPPVPSVVPGREPRPDRDRGRDRPHPGGGRDRDGQR